MIHLNQALGISTSWILLSLSILGRADAATYYVSTTGSDSNSCASARSPGTSAKRNHQGAGGAVACLSGGDTLITQAGAYTLTGLGLFDVIPPGIGEAAPSLNAKATARACCSAASLSETTTTTSPSRISGSTASTGSARSNCWRPRLLRACIPATSRSSTTSSTTPSRRLSMTATGSSTSS